MMVRVLEPLELPGEYSGSIGSGNQSEGRCIVRNTLEEGAGHAIPPGTLLMGIADPDRSGAFCVSYDPHALRAATVGDRVRAALKDAFPDVPLRVIEPA